MSEIKGKKGFTIIEVVLVLAIAGLIFLMVFIALPALQRSQRDTQRRDDLARVATAITQYQTNNSGKIPGQGASADIKSAVIASGTCSASTINDATKLLCGYLNSSEAASAGKNEFIDPDGTDYSITIKKVGTYASPTTVDHIVYIHPKAKCDGEKAIASDNNRDYAIIYKLEGTGTYCSDNR